MPETNYVPDPRPVPYTYHPSTELGGGSGTGTGNLSGIGSPEGVVTADEGTLYVDTSTTPPSIWAKKTGSGDTGWMIEIEGV